MEPCVGREGGREGGGREGGREGGVMVCATEALFLLCLTWCFCDSVVMVRGW